MAVCAAPWPSQIRSARGNSERHSALARMKERHARSEFAEEEPPSRCAPQPRAPAKPRAVEGRSGRSGGLNNSGLSDPGSARGGAAEPWAPAWDPRDGSDSPPPKPQRPVAPGESHGSWARPEKPALQDSGGYTPRSNRVRGPAEVKTARDNEADDECLPPGAQAADFKTLHAMIARGIQDAEAGAAKLEKDVPPARSPQDDEEERRYRDRQNQRRRDEEAQRDKERQRAREKRRKEQEERERRQAEELEREEKEELALREAREHSEAQCRKELKAATRIQSHLRGRWSRMGKTKEVRMDVKAVLHWESYMKSSD